MHPLDPYRAAKLLIDARGPKAAAKHAEERIGDLAGDDAGAAAWRKVRQAIADLADEEPKFGQRRH